MTEKTQVRKHINISQNPPINQKSQHFTKHNISQKTTFYETQQNMKTQHFTKHRKHILQSSTIQKTQQHFIKQNIKQNISQNRKRNISQNTTTIQKTQHFLKWCVLHLRATIQSSFIAFINQLSKETNIRHTVDH